MKKLINSESVDNKQFRTTKRMKIVSKRRKGKQKKLWLKQGRISNRTMKREANRID